VASKQYQPGTSKFNQFISALSAGSVDLLVDNNWKVKRLTTTNLKRALDRCTSPFIVLTLALRREGASGHQNALIINKRLRTYERFEPQHKQNTAHVDEYLNSAQFRKHLPDRDYKYISVDESCPYFGPQAKQDKAHHCPQGGYCVVFSMMYLHLRLLMPLSTPSEVYEMWLQLSSSQLLDTIQRYYGWVEEVLGDDIAPNVSVAKLQSLVSPSIRV
jgi:hypothetical protein